MAFTINKKLFEDENRVTSPLATRPFDVPVVFRSDKSVVYKPETYEQVLKVIERHFTEYEDESYTIDDVLYNFDISEDRGIENECFLIYSEGSPEEVYCCYKYDNYLCARAFNGEVVGIDYFNDKELSMFLVDNGGFPEYFNVEKGAPLEAQVKHSIPWKDLLNMIEDCNRYGRQSRTNGEWIVNFFEDPWDAMGFYSGDASSYNDFKRYLPEYEVSVKLQQMFERNDIHFSTLQDVVKYIDENEDDDESYASDLILAVEKAIQSGEEQGRIAKVEDYILRCIQEAFKPLTATIHFDESVELTGTKEQAMNVITDALSWDDGADTIERIVEDSYFNENFECNLEYFNDYGFDTDAFEDVLEESLYEFLYDLEARKEEEFKKQYPHSILDFNGETGEYEDDVKENLNEDNGILTTREPNEKFRFRYSSRLLPQYIIDNEGIIDELNDESNGFFEGAEKIFIMYVGDEYRIAIIFKDAGDYPHSYRLKEGSQCFKFLQDLGMDLESLKSNNIIDEDAPLASRGLNIEHQVDVEFENKVKEAFERIYNCEFTWCQDILKNRHIVGWYADNVPIAKIKFDNFEIKFYPHLPYDYWEDEQKKKFPKVNGKIDWESLNVFDDADLNEFNDGVGDTTDEPIEVDIRFDYNDDSEYTDLGCDIYTLDFLFDVEIDPDDYTRWLNTARCPYEIKMIDLSETLKEARTALSDDTVRKYVEDCVKVLNDAGYDATMSDIVIQQTDATRTFGTMKCKTWENGDYTLSLSKHLFSEPEETIKNTIYHELCHYLQYKEAFEDGAFYFDTWGRVKARRDLYSQYGGHGRVWKKYARDVGRLTNQEITRTNSFQMHTGAGQAYDEKIKYVVKCAHCGAEIKATKLTKFMKSVLDGNGKSDNWYHNCPDGTKCDTFEIIKRK